MNIKQIALAIFSGITFFGCGVTDNDNPSPGDTVFFLVTEFEPNKGYSYILPLTDAGDIAKARAIIKDRDNEDLDRLVVARVQAASGNEAFLNKDLLKKKTWSWKVTEFQGFAGSTIEILDGGPDDVEKDMDWWFENTGDGKTYGTIGFWGYTVEREVNPDELRNK